MRRGSMPKRWTSCCAGCKEKTLNAETRTHRFKDVPMELAPLQQPHPPLWYGVHSPESAERAARMGSNIACNEPAEASAGYIARYWSAWREHQGDRAPPPKAGVTHFVVVAERRRRGARDRAPRLSGLAPELPSSVPPPRPGGEDQRRRSRFRRARRARQGRRGNAREGAAVSEGASRQNRRQLLHQPVRVRRPDARRIAAVGRAVRRATCAGTASALTNSSRREHPA